MHIVLISHHASRHKGSKLQLAQAHSNQTLVMEQWWCLPEQHGQDDSRLHERKLVPHAFAGTAAEGYECKVGRLLIGVQ